MTWLSINPDSEPYNRLRLAADIQGKFNSVLITPEELAESYNLIEQMGCELPSPGQPVIVPADSHDWEDDE
jgi:hypothetical protein